MGVELSTILNEVWSYWQGGGFVMPPLVAATAVLWFGLGWRLIALRRGSSETLRELVERAVAGDLADDSGLVVRAVRRGVPLAEGAAPRLRPLLDDAFSGLDGEMSRFSTLVGGLVAAAPLAGLLGTVTGMIETFASLGDMALFSQSGGVAGGISVALISTQMGLAVAIPGLFAGRLLEQREQRFRAELEELKDILVAERERIRAGSFEIPD
ncbi:MAG: MotA/TolQ/ExbB proton channel family protein [Bradymonadaceae bacterium]